MILGVGVDRQFQFFHCTQNKQTEYVLHNMYNLFENLPPALKWTSHYPIGLKIMKTHHCAVQPNEWVPFDFFRL